VGFTLRRSATIADRKRVEDALRKSEESARQLAQEKRDHGGDRPNHRLDAEY